MVHHGSKSPVEVELDRLKEAHMQVSIQQASEVISAAEAKARELGVPVIITVLDSGCHIKALHRMDDAPLGSIDISMGKARTAALHGGCL